MPKCSGPTRWTRGWITPRDFWMNTLRCGWRRFRERVVDMRATSEVRDHTSRFLDGGPKCSYLLTKLHTRCQGVRNCFRLTDGEKGKTGQRELCRLAAAPM